MNTVYVSLPIHPNLYPARDRSSWAQISYFVYDALSKRYPVKFITFNEDVPVGPMDVLVSCLPNSNVKKRPDRTIIVDNDNFDVNKWKFGRFKKYGLDAPTDHTWDLNHFFDDLFGAIIKTNDVAISKWNSDHEDVLEKKIYLSSRIKNLVIIPHPIDKSFFGKLYNPNQRFDKLRMLVYNAPWRKNAVQLVNMLKAHFPDDVYSVVGALNKTEFTVKHIITNFAYLAHTSYSEGFPYFANEFLTQGVLLYGHEEWWEPYGHNILKWSYDPEKQNQNLVNLKTLLAPGFAGEYHKMRRDILQKHIDRTDNNWEHLTSKLIEMVDKLA